MKVFTYSEAEQNFSTLPESAKRMGISDLSMHTGPFGGLLADE
ncbi:hypothetical protein QUF80_01480 [Desulfococcaceae bacterium HSG8]|nr:hypothetical protein [Desulfococcaceae bacterium HSG8]